MCLKTKGAENEVLDVFENQVDLKILARILLRAKAKATNRSAESGHISVSVSILFSVSSLPSVSGLAAC